MLQRITLASFACLLAACASGPEADPEFEMIRLEHTPANDMSEILETMAGGPGATIAIQADPRTNSILISGSQEEIVKAKELIARLDVKVESMEPAADERVFEVIALEFADATQIAETIQDLVDSATRTAGRGNPAKPSNAPTILADARSNSLLIAADADTMPQIKELIVRLDTEQ